MYFLLRSIKHRILGSNQHGVHSPFVYDFVIKCLYVKPKIDGNKNEGVLLKSITYFSVSALKLVTTDSKLASRIEKDFGHIVIEKHPFDLIYLDAIDANVLSNYLKQIKNDSMIFLGNIHRNKKTTTIWKKIIQDERVTVSIDMLHCGALFFRKEQEKEHFKIRI